MRAFAGGDSPGVPKLFDIDRLSSRGPDRCTSSHRRLTAPYCTSAAYRLRPFAARLRRYCAGVSTSTLPTLCP
jgi:hypothetical protein